MVGRYGGIVLAKPIGLAVVAIVSENKGSLMTIDKAIELLQREKHNGVKNVICAWWVAEDFTMKDDDAWGDVCDKIDDRMDWAVADEALCYEIEWYT